MSNLYQVSEQWRTRPDDQRFGGATTEEAFNAAIAATKAAALRSRQGVETSKKIRFITSENKMDGLQVTGVGGDDPLVLTNWAFDQAARLAGGSAVYLSKLPAALAADCIDFGLQALRQVEDLGYYLESSTDDGIVDANGNPVSATGKFLKALTGPNYGRLFNFEVLEKIRQNVDLNVWKVPGIRGQALGEISKQDTTIYASDRDMFIFLCDEVNRIELPNRRNGQTGTLARGFIVGNSEVGKSSVFVLSFLFDFVCGNRIVWGAEEVHEIRVRHTKSVAARWEDNILPVIEAYSRQGVGPAQARILAAQAKKIDKATDWLAERYGKNTAATLQQIHQIEENRPIETLWDVSTALTAKARATTYQDARIEQEREAGKVLALAA